MSNERETESEAFRKWFESQTTYKSLAAMERAMNITEDYLNKIKRGSRRALDPELRRKIKEATGLEAFHPLPVGPEDLNSHVLNKPDLPDESQNLHASSEVTEPRIVQFATKEKNLKTVETSRLINEIIRLREEVDLIYTKLIEANVDREIAESPTTSNAEARAKTVMRLLMALASELEFFKRCTESERKTFKKIVPGQDVGYITSLLRALYDEDKFQRWLLFSAYTMKGKENGN